MTPSRGFRLLAGMRLTGAEPHLGTFYGWVRPVAAAAEEMDVIVLIADSQSLDPLPQRPIGELAHRLERALRPHLPGHVPIIRESTVRGLAALAYLAKPLFAAHHWNRVAPLRRITRTNSLATVATMLYPAMMIADVLAFDATHVLAKPEGSFQHADVLNDVLARGVRRYRWPQVYLHSYPKPKVDVPDSSGSGPMKRNKPGHLSIGTDAEGIAAWASQLPAPGHQSHGETRIQDCRVVWPIWQATAAGRPSNTLARRKLAEIYRECMANRLACMYCKEQLAAKLTRDLEPQTPPSATRTPATQTIGRAQRRALEIVRQTVHNPMSE